MMRLMPSIGSALDSVIDSKRITLYLLFYLLQPVLRYAHYYSLGSILGLTASTRPIAAMSLLCLLHIHLA
jgi:hypothetical protein